MDLGLRRRDFALAGEMMGTQRVGKDVLDQIIQTVHMLFLAPYRNCKLAVTVAALVPQIVSASVSPSARSHLSDCI